MNVADADRNLLFGVLALQLDFITKEALLEAMHAWVLVKERPLADLLVERGDLAAPRRRLLESLVEEHLRQHGGDVERSLAALPALTPICTALDQVADADVRHTLASLSATRSGAGESMKTGEYVPPPAEPTERFQRLRLHAKGGLGEVHIALDRELNRQVALKEIQRQHADDPRSRQRFELEAEITGGLEHPGIVPVYGMGRHFDGRPYYAMRFIKGSSLRDAIADFHSKNQDRRRLEGVAFRKLLARFLAVCDAVAYAHSRGVLHRDLKPSNILLGPYGETLVVDWGLAKSGVGELEPARSASGELPEAPLQPSGLSDGSGSLTLPGSLLGTPAFMSPEQAEGRLDQLGPESDVYSLGATLYCLLTGKAPFGDGSQDQVLRQVRRGDFPAPRQVNPRVPVALEAICLKAMALGPADRYLTARALAEDLEHWLADEPVRAHFEPPVSRARRWGRRHRPLVAALVALVATALLLVGVGLGWEQQRRADTARAAEEDLARAEQALAADRRDEAAQALERAGGRLERGGSAALIRRLERLRTERAVADELVEVQRLRATYLGLPVDNAKLDAGYSQAFGKLDIDVAALGPEVAAERIRAATIAEKLVTALDDWAAARRQLPGSDSDLLLAVADQADDDAWRRQLRAFRRQRDAAGLERLAADDDALKQQPANLARLGGALHLSGKLKEAEKLLRAANRRYEDDFWINFELANLLLDRRRNDPAEAVGFFRAALALRPNTAGLYNNIGIAYQRQKKYAQAIDAFHEAISLLPLAAGLHYNLGNVYLEQERWQDAEAALRKAVQVDNQYTEAHFNLGRALQGLQSYAEAAQEFSLSRERALAKGNTTIVRVAGEAIQECERWRPLAALFAMVQNGEAKAHTAREWAELGDYALEQKHLPATAAGFYEKALTLDAGVIQTYRYNAACAAAQVGCGQGKDASSLDGKERDRLRGRARVWLRDELEAQRAKLAGGLSAKEINRVIGFLRHWAQDPDLSGVRDDKKLAQLPEMERRDWQKFWAEVQDFLQSVSGKD
jgi:tetratricopeptide (TPR) repeat protein/tRNA A-37 threonylcarbamoyl transferase component Bud32